MVAAVMFALPAAVVVLPTAVVLAACCRGNRGEAVATDVARSKVVSESNMVLACLFTQLKQETTTPLVHYK